MEHFPLALLGLDALERKWRGWGTAQQRFRALQRALGVLSAADSEIRESIGYRKDRGAMGEMSMVDGRWSGFSTAIPSTLD